MELGIPGWDGLLELGLLIWEYFGTYYSFGILCYLLGRAIEVQNRSPRPQTYFETIMPGGTYETGLRCQGISLSRVRLDLEPGTIKVSLLAQGAEVGLLIATLMFIFDATLALLALMVIELGRLNYVFRIPLPMGVLERLLRPTAH